MLYIISYVLALHCNTKLFCPKLDLIIAQINQRQNHIQFCLNGLVHDSLRAIRVENFYQNKKNSDCLAAKVSECWTIYEFYTYYIYLYIMFQSTHFRSKSDSTYCRIVPETDQSISSSSLSLTAVSHIGRTHSRPIRGQNRGHVIILDQL